MLLVLCKVSHVSTVHNNPHMISDVYRHKDINVGIGNQDGGKTIVTNGRTLLKNNMSSAPRSPLHITDGLVLAFNTCPIRCIFLYTVWAELADTFAPGA